MIPLFFTLSYFNSHAHVERDFFSLAFNFHEVDFNSHAHVERDSSFVTPILACSSFQLTRSRGAWPGSFFSYRNEDGYFNSHAHVERDRTVFTVKSQSSISTHTLTWSVTIADCKCSVISYISTHTLTWSVTTVRSFLALSIPFQLTRSRGAWRRSLWHCIMLFIISTHTLTWSVTSLALHQYLFLYNFNSHAHVERDCVAGYLGQCIINFNSHAHVERDIATLTLSIEISISTHTLTWSVTYSFSSILNAPLFQLTRSRGAWPYITDSNLVCKLDFNSHAHVERDLQRVWNLMLKRISTHTLTWSVTNRKKKCLYLNGFQLTRSRGAWHVWLRLSWICRRFQLTRSRGAWRLQFLFLKWGWDFNSHAHVERDTFTYNTFTIIFPFQLTRSRGAWLASLAVCSSSNPFQLTRSRGAWHLCISTLLKNWCISTHTLTWSVTGF